MVEYMGRGMKRTDGTQWQIYDDQLYYFADKAWQQILAVL
jgi:hypothetical protein